MPATPLPLSAPAAPAPEPFDLPNPSHATRLPRRIGKAQFSRLRHASYALPQVVRPGDFGNDALSLDEAALDAHGLVLLHPASAGVRASRWIEPGLMESALAHIDAVGSGSGVRPLMLDRAAALDALGLARVATGWSRLVSHVLVLPEPGWRIPVLFRVPIDSAAVWTFFRDGDLGALQATLGPPPDYPHAAELQTHLEALLARAHSGHPRQLESLLARLQSECATAQPIAELMAACTRAQDRWEQRVAELETLEVLTSELAFRGYPDSFETARQLQRSVTLYVGAPNSGKTHAAFERLALAQSGAYLAPLRLLALEGRDRLAARGVACSLLTGEENVPAPGARVVSSTIEMVGIARPVDVAVIDEAQMIFDASRGWAWTQAIVGVPANEVIVICSAYAVPAIQNLLGLCGERCELRRFERKQYVQPLPRPVPLQDLMLGDAVVAFSRRDVLMLRDRIGAAGHPVSVIYGALPPEVRRREAERFATGASHIMVATDAIGMGLNLPIRRVLFSTLTKFDGQDDRALDASEVHQIAGRAGRFGMHEEGFVGVLDQAEPEALGSLKELLARSPRAPVDFKAPVAPNRGHVRTIAARLHLTRLREVLGVFVEQLELDDAHFAVAELDAMLLLAEQLDRSAGTLSLEQRFIYAQAPVDIRTESQLQQFLDWSGSHAATGTVGAPWFLNEVDGHSRLDRMEQALRGCTLWLWLDLRFPGVYGHVDAVLALREQLNDGIERQLKGKRPLAQARVRGRRPGP